MTRKFIENLGVLFDSHMKFCHTSYAPGLSVYSKDMAFERALKSAQNTHMRNKSIVFSFLFFFALSLRTNLFISIQIRK